MSSADESDRLLEQLAMLEEELSELCLMQKDYQRLIAHHAVVEREVIELRARVADLEKTCRR